MKSTVLTFVIALCTTFLLSCNGKKEETTSENKKEDSHEHASGSTAPEQASKPAFEVDGKFREQLSAVFTSYVTMKDALVGSDASKVKAEAANTSSALANVDMKLLTGAAHNDWMTYVAPMEKSLKEMASSDDLEAQRKSFSSVSENLYKSIKAFGLSGDQAFYEYCPMAFNNEGAYWLSSNDQIRNPYFGDKMLTCGQVVEKLQ